MHAIPVIMCRLRSNKFNTSTKYASTLYSLVVIQNLDWLWQTNGLHLT
ncbi:MAG: hypothetical protein ACJATO_002896 [Arenicella sp.]